MSEVEIRKQLAKTLHEALGQHMIGTMLAAQGLVRRLQTHGQDAHLEAEKLVELLEQANKDLGRLILALDGGRKR